MNIVDTTAIIGIMGIMDFMDTMVTMDIMNIMVIMDTIGTISDIAGITQHTNTIMVPLHFAPIITATASRQNILDPPS